MGLPVFLFLEIFLLLLRALLLFFRMYLDFEFRQERKPFFFESGGFLFAFLLLFLLHGGIILSPRKKAYGRFRNLFLLHLIAVFLTLLIASHRRQHFFFRQTLMCLQKQNFLFVERFEIIPIFVDGAVYAHHIALHVEAHFGHIARNAADGKQGVVVATLPTVFLVGAGAQVIERIFGTDEIVGAQRQGRLGNHPARTHPLTVGLEQRHNLVVGKIVAGAIAYTRPIPLHDFQRKEIGMRQTETLLHRRGKRRLVYTLRPRSLRHKKQEEKQGRARKNPCMCHRFPHPLQFVV